MVSVQFQLTQPKYSLLKIFMAKVLVGLRLKESQLGKFSFNRPSAKIFFAKDSQGQTKFQLAFGQKNLNQRKISFNRPSAKIFSTIDGQNQTKFQLAFGQKNLNQRKFSFTRPSAEIFSTIDGQDQTKFQWPSAKRISIKE